MSRWIGPHVSHAISKGQIPFTILKLTAIFAILWLCLNHPPPGYSVALIAVVAALISIHADMKGWQKAIWMILIGVLLVIELRSISADRESNNKANKEAAEKQNEQFQNILDNNRQQLLAILEDNRNKFSQTMDRSDRIFSSVQQSIDFATGGDSVCYMAFWGNDTYTNLEHGISLVQSYGKYPLYDVTAIVTDQITFAGLNPREQASINVPSTYRYMLGNIGAGMLTSNLETMRIRFFGRQSQRFIVQFSARNGAWTELIRMARKDDKWLSALRVTTPDRRQKVLYEKIDNGFPKEQIDWK